MNRNYETSDEQLKHIIQTALSARRAMQTTILDTRMKIVDEIDDNEWQKIFAEDKDQN